MTTNNILINNRVNQVTGATDWLTFADAGFPDLPETYTIADLDANRATDGGHYRNLYGIRLGKIPDPDTLRIFEYLADSNSDSFDSDTEAGAEYTRAASWPPGAGEFATSGNGDIVYFAASQNGVQVAVLPYRFRCTPLTLDKIKAFAQAAVSGSELDALVDAAVGPAIDDAFASAASATSPANPDEFPLLVSSVLKKITWANLLTAIQSALGLTTKSYIRMKNGTARDAVYTNVVTYDSTPESGGSGITAVNDDSGTRKKAFQVTTAGLYVVSVSVYIANTNKEIRVGSSVDNASNDSNTRKAWVESAQTSQGDTWAGYVPANHYIWIYCDAVPSGSDRNQISILGPL